MVAVGLFGACCSYLVSSAGMSIFNKLAITALPLPITLVLIQMVFTVATTLAGWRAVHIGSRLDALRWGCTVPLLFNAMLVSSMYAMRHNTLGTISVFRNVAPLITLCIERAFHVPIEIDRDSILSLFTILAGVILYHFSAIHISSLGLTAIFVNIVFAVLERLLQRHLLSHNPVDISKPGMMLINNTVGVALNGALLLAYNEAAEWPVRLQQLGGGEWTMIVASCLNGVAISYAGLRVQQLVTATTFMVLTNANKFVVILFGIMALNEKTSLLSSFGMALSIGGALWYAKARAALAERPRPKGDEDETKPLQPVP